MKPRRILLDCVLVLVTFSACGPPAPTPTSVIEFSTSTPTQIQNCAHGWSRLAKNTSAMVTFQLLNVRSKPNKGDNVIAEIDQGMVVKVIDGPVCSDGLVFWRIESDQIPGGVGWLAEGDLTEYYLEPYVDNQIDAVPLSKADLRSAGQIAFLNGRVWYSVINADGSDVIALVDPIGGEHSLFDEAYCSVAWSPAGNILAVIRDGSFFTLPADGTSVKKIIGTEGIGYCVDWSPDGRYIAFAAGGTKGSPAGPDYYSDIFIIRPDGTGLKRITSSDKNCNHPDWSADNKWLIFDCVDWSSGTNIYLSAWDGSQVENLSDHDYSGSSRHPVWSPDGNSIAFESQGNSSNDNQSNIYLMDPNGTNIRQLTNNGRTFFPVWSPDGKLILFTRVSMQRNTEVYVMDANGGNKRRIVENVELNSIPSWSPDSRYIAYGSGSLISIMEVASGRSFVLVLGYAPIWSPLAIPRLPDCTNGWTRLIIGKHAIVAAGDPNRVRSGPSTSDERIAQIYPGTIVKVLEGPICADGLIFWKIENESIPGGAGWTAEGDGTNYWLEPYTP